MKQHHPLISFFIQNKLKEKGITSKQLVFLLGRRNRNKAFRKINTLLIEKKADTALLKDLFSILNISEHDIENLLHHEAIARNEVVFRKWVQYCRIPDKETVLCNRCVYLDKDEGECSHENMKKIHRKLYFARFAGYIRPRWCPIR